MSEFIILSQNRSEMVLCSMCPDPGHCCRNFDSTLIYWDDATPEEVTHYMEFVAGEHMPWIPLGPGPRKFAQGGRTYSHWRFDCPKLDSTGRCTIYAERPQACRSLVPGTVGVCVFSKIPPFGVREEVSPFPALGESAG
jgi:Fe-S-cluster containining protein